MDAGGSSNDDEMRGINGGGNGGENERGSDSDEQISFH